MGETTKTYRVSGQFPILLMALGVGVFIGDHFWQLTWWAILKLLFWPVAAGYYAAEYVYLRGW